MLELLKGTTSHPNAIWLYEKMKPQFPNLSISTVYRNLGILEEQGLLQRLSCSTFDRYDANTTMHTHFYCSNCERVYDMDADDLEYNLNGCARNTPHQIEGCSVTFYGICENCKSINKK